MVFFSQGIRNIYIFQDTSLKAEEEKDFLRTEECKRGAVSRFGSLENRMGKIAVITDLKVSGEVVYDMLKIRMDIEQAYDTLKNTIHADRTYSTLGKSLHVKAGRGSLDPLIAFLILSGSFFSLVIVFVTVVVSSCMFLLASSDPMDWSGIRVVVLEGNPREEACASLFPFVARIACCSQSAHKKQV